MTYILILIAGLANGWADRIQFNFGGCPYFMHRNKQFWNPKLSWTNKWSRKDYTKERFFGSSTFLVFLTDGWHLLKEIQLSSICAALAILSGVWWYYILFRFVFALGFSMNYYKWKLWYVVAFVFLWILAGVIWYLINGQT